MKKILTSLLVLNFALVSLFAQSDDDLFGGADDDFFGDDGIVELEETQVSQKSDEADLKKGVLFQDGAVKVGGSFDTSISTATTVYADDDKNFKDHLYETTLTPTASAFLTVDARPNQNLRMYTKFGVAYPFQTTAASSTELISIKAKEIEDIANNPMAGALLGEFPVTTGATTTTTVTDYLKLKELFTDFNLKDTAYFRFGVHTVTWGAGYFFSPVSDIINTSSINPEDVDAQVDGALNLRTQIVFPNSQNCIWLYVVPSTDFTTANSVTSYARETALAGKADFLIGDWELGAGGFYKYEHAPKLALTATGSISKLGIFGEGVYQYGGASEWEKNQKWNEDKTHIFQATAGCMYTWKTPSITLAGQYYYDGNNVDKLMDIDETTDFGTYKIQLPRITEGHNVAALLSFGRIAGTTDLTASVFAMANFGRSDYVYDVDKEIEDYLGTKEDQIASSFNELTVSAMMYYSPISELKMGVGPYVTMSDFDNPPKVDLKLSFTLGGGKF